MHCQTHVPTHRTRCTLQRCPPQQGPSARRAISGSSQTQQTHLHMCFSSSGTGRGRKHAAGLSHRHRWQFGGFGFTDHQRVVTRAAVTAGACSHSAAGIGRAAPIWGCSKQHRAQVLEQKKETPNIIFSTAFSSLRSCYNPSICSLRLIKTHHVHLLLSLVA